MSLEATKLGWISLHRTMLDHPFWGAEKFTKAQAWIDLILNANHKESRVMIKGQFINVDRGQQIRSQVTLAKKWKWDRKTVHRFLKLLESDLMIVQHGTHLTTIITICNYSEFQDRDKNSPQLKGHVVGQVEGHTVPSERGTNNNDNNANNVNNDNKKPKPKKPQSKIELDYSCWPSMPDKQIMDDWLAMRKSKKFPISQTVINTQGKQYVIAVTAGYTMNECVAEAATRGWAGFKAKWMDNATGSNKSQAQDKGNIMEFVHGKRPEKIIN